MAFPHRTSFDWPKADIALDIKDCYILLTFRSVPRPPSLTDFSNTNTERLRSAQVRAPFLPFRVPAGKIFYKFSSGRGGRNCCQQPPWRQPGWERALPWQKQRPRCAAPKQSFVTAWDDQAPPPSHSSPSAGNMRQHISVNFAKTEH